MIQTSVVGVLKYMSPMFSSDLTKLTNLKNIIIAEKLETKLPQIIFSLMLNTSLSVYSVEILRLSEGILIGNFVHAYNVANIPVSL